MSRWIVAALAVLCAAVGAAPAAAATADGCPSVGTDWAGAGPFAVTTQATGGGQTIYRPAQLGTLGCTTHPVVLWGNGTGASPTNYDGLLRHWASEGFIVAAADTRNAYSGKEMIGGLDWLVAQSSTAGSPFQGRVDTAHVAASGHSQGGGGAMNAGGDPRVGVTLPIEPSPYADVAALHGPMLLLSGSQDVVVEPDLVAKPTWQKATQIPAWYGELAGANHLTPINDGGAFRGPTTAWLRAMLMGDDQATPLFTGPSCGYCADPIWTEFLRNANAQSF